MGRRVRKVTIVCKGCEKEVTVKVHASHKERKYCSRPYHQKHVGRITKTCKSPKCKNTFSCRKSDSKKYCCSTCFFDTIRGEKVIPKRAGDIARSDYFFWSLIEELTHPSKINFVRIKGSRCNRVTLDQVKSIKKTTKKATIERFWYRLKSRCRIRGLAIKGNNPEFYNTKGQRKPLFLDTEKTMAGLKEWRQKQDEK